MKNLGKEIIDMFQIDGSNDIQEGSNISYNISYNDLNIIFFGEKAYIFRTGIEELFYFLNDIESKTSILFSGCSIDKIKDGININVGMIFNDDGTHIEDMHKIEKELNKIGYTLL